MSSDEELPNTPGSAQDDLFGSDDEAPAEKSRQLSDEDLDSGDDEGRRDRARSEQADDQGQEGRVARVMEADVARHPLPKPIDGEYNTLRLPNFLSIEPNPYDPETFEVPTTDHHSDTRSKNFSASTTAATTLRFRKSQITGQYESNTVVYKWSDGSSSIAVGGEHYELQGKPLGPPKDKPYQPLQDSHTYLASPAIISQLLNMVGHMSNQYTVRPNQGVVDEALEKLQMSLAAATRRNNKGDEKGPEIIASTIDPELQKKQAEQAEKERVKAQRRRDLAAEKANLPRGYSARGGLNVGDLEGRSGRRAPSGVKRAGPKRKAGGYGSDDSEPRGRGYGDEYVDEDGFLAPSEDEEEPEEDDEDEEEDILDDASDDGRPKAKRAKISKQEEGSDADADADLDDDEIPSAPIASEPAGRGRNRHIIEDDDDE